MHKTKFIVIKLLLINQSWSPNRPGAELCPPQHNVVSLKPTNICAKLQLYLLPIRIQGYETFLGIFPYVVHLSCFRWFVYLNVAELLAPFMSQLPNQDGSDVSYPGKSWELKIYLTAIQNRNFIQNFFGLVPSYSNTQ